MKIVILAAGQGIRMKPLTLTTPKPLLVYKGKTALDHIFEKLPVEITEAIFVVDYMAEKIKSYCQNKFHGRRISYVQGEQSGNALGFLKTEIFFSAGERFVVMYADDILTKKEIEECLSKQFSWLSYFVEKTNEVGILTIDKVGKIINFTEKPQTTSSRLAADGFMVVNSDIFSYKPKLHINGEYYFSDLMAEFVEYHDVVAVIGDTNHSQLTYPHDLERLNNQDDIS